MNADCKGCDIGKGMLAGLIAGAAASAVMSGLQTAWAKMQEDSNGQGGSGQQNEEPATAKAAEAISEGVFEHHLTKEEKKTAAPAVHYAFGSLNGALYGGIAEVYPAARAAGGSLFGITLWLAADEATVPALGLSKWPTEYPASTHLYGLASHVVYGLTTELLRGAIRRAI